ncbi:hypothetical protein [Burkholderia territorii]|uniref:hypothetical protein n=1 Tax=Burkholderia territorii TaxID=1503055 RepID=UPI00075C1696|nr:hypothetical protein [Burkholderia territorii]KWE37392.1 hypothetical protein WT49_11190 [Burkholderia territorii]KWE38432.1 hypothetical protein WT50_20045 [Burkholderia territorii]KWE40311.1 hypothetical protein WT51_27940 [Burkholderia territorii]
MNHEQLLERIKRLEARIAELERDLYSMPEMDERRQRRQLIERFRAQGMSGKQAKNAAWREMHVPS